MVDFALADEKGTLANSRLRKKKCQSTASTGISWYGPLQTVTFVAKLENQLETESSNLDEAETHDGI
jgi:hypothetical protein